MGNYASKEEAGKFLPAKKIVAKEFKRLRARATGNSLTATTNTAVIGIIQWLRSGRVTALANAINASKRTR